MHSLGYTGNPDIGFLSMMILHHEGAIEMARLILIYGTDPLVRKIAEDIAAQTIEIEAMREIKDLKEETRSRARWLSCPRGNERNRKIKFFGGVLWKEKEL